MKNHEGQGSAMHRRAVFGNGMGWTGSSLLGSILILALLLSGAPAHGGNIEAQLGQSIYTWGESPSTALDASRPRACEEVPSLSGVLEETNARLTGRAVRFPSPMSRGGERSEKSVAPYFFVPGEDSDTERLPMKETRVEADILGVIAGVRIFQVFENTGKKPIEAVYVFPASTRAAVHGMRMRIGERTIEAVIDKRDQARKRYEEAKEAGKRASLLEQERSNVFTMNVANIMPGDRIEVQLEYSEILAPEDAQYEFMFPAVVGPRYGGGADPLKDRWISNPYLKSGEPEPYQFDIRVRLATSIPIKEIGSPSHKVSAFFESRQNAVIRLDQKHGGNKDFILRYRLAGDRIETGVSTVQGPDGGWFMVMIEPPLRASSLPIPDREFIFVVDVSGSMRGFPLDTAKSLMERLLSDLKRSDLLNVVLFAGASQVMHPAGSVPATEENIREAVNLIGQQAGGGGTELMTALEQAYGIPKPEGESAATRTVVVITDGFVGVENRSFQFIRERLNESNLFAFGIGVSVNRALIEGMARAGQGEPFVVLRSDLAGKEADRFRRYIDTPVLTDIKASFEGMEAYDVAPQVLPDLLAARPLLLLGRMKGNQAGRIRITGSTGKKPYVETLPIQPASSETSNAPLAVLWARKWVELLGDQRTMLPEDASLEAAITNLGLCYHFLTDFTSFVAVDTHVANETGEVVTVRQPLPLPEGVPDTALPGSSYAAAAPMPTGARYHTALAEEAPPAGGIRPKEEDVEEVKPVEPEKKAFDFKFGFEAEDLTKIQALEEAVREKVVSVAKRCVSRAGTFKFKVLVNRFGTVTALTIVESPGSEKQDLCILDSLTGIQTETHASEAEYGTLRVTLEIREK